MRFGSSSNSSSIKAMSISPAICDPKMIERPQPFGVPGEPISEQDVALKISSMPAEGDIVNTNHFGQFRLVKELSAGGEGIIAYSGDRDR